MHRRGLIIRFIDVGLIILFGFMMISDLKINSQIVLPGKADANSFDQFGEMVELKISIYDNDTFSIENIAEDRELHDGVGSIEELEFILRTLKRRYGEDGRIPVVFIDPEPQARIQLLVDIIDVCERLELEKNLYTEKAIADQDS